MQTNLKEIKRISKEKEIENWEFRNYLKRYDVPIADLDSIVHKIYYRVSSRIDCTMCSNCCRCFYPILNIEDIHKLSEGMGISTPQFKDRFLQKKNEDNSYVLKNSSCPFLKGNLCSQYEFRPEACSSFPHLHRADFIFRLNNILNNYSICPIVFNVYEILKTEIWTQTDLPPENTAAPQKLRKKI